MQTNADALLRAVETPLLPGEAELTQLVTEILTQEGFSPESLNVFWNDPNILFARGKNNNVQRYKLNQFLNSQYLSIPMDTQNERGMLLDAGPKENWLQVFRMVHVPAMRAFGLPRSLYALV